MAKRDTEKESVKKPEVEKPYHAPGLFRFLYESVLKKKTGQNQGGQSIIGKIGNAFDDYKEVRESHKRSLTTYEIIFESSRLSGEYFILLVGSTIIASFGLLQNSAAVIIGAMIIAPLMVPILGFALGSFWGDRRLIGQSALTLLVGIAGAVSLSAVIGFAMPGVEMNEQILARTNPTLYDIIIALASGFVGSFAFVNPKISPSISGVAIAVALVPPLAVTGISLGNLHWAAAMGSFLLFASNLVSISLAASFVFWRMKVHPYLPDTEEVSSRMKRNFLLSTMTLILIAIPLGFFMKETLYIKHQKTQIENVVKNDLPYEQISLELNKYVDTYHVKCQVISSKEANPEIKEKILNDIKQLFTEPVEIKLIILKSL